MEIVNLIIALISGALGGNLAGAALSPNKNLGGVANSIIGLIGGGAGDFILKALGVIGTAASAAPGAAPATGTEFDIGSILATIIGGGVSGGVLTGIITFIKDAMQKK